MLGIDGKDGGGAKPVECPSLLEDFDFLSFLSFLSFLTFVKPLELSELEELLDEDELERERPIECDKVQRGCKLKLRFFIFLVLYELRKAMMRTQRIRTQHSINIPAVLFPNIGANLP